MQYVLQTISTHFAHKEQIAYIIVDERIATRLVKAVVRGESEQMNDHTHERKVCQLSRLSCIARFNFFELHRRVNGISVQ